MVMNHDLLVINYDLLNEIITEVYSRKEDLREKDLLHRQYHFLWVQILE